MSCCPGECTRGMCAWSTSAFRTARWSACGRRHLPMSRRSGAAELRALLGDRRLNVVALGPGLGVSANTRELVLAALDGRSAVVLDADALTSFADEPGELFTAIAVNPARPVILTPHQGEFER